MIDLPKLETIVFDQYSHTEKEDNQDSCKAIINGYPSFDRTLVMKSNWKYEYNIYYCIDLPSLTMIQSNSKFSTIFSNFGKAIFESRMIYHQVKSSQVNIKQGKNNE